MSPDSPQLTDSLYAIRDRWRLVVVVVVVAAGLALVSSLSSDKQYDATAQLLIRSQEPADALLDPTGAQRSDDPERDLNTAVELIKVGPIVHNVIRTLRLRRNADDLLAQVHTDISGTSDIVGIRVRDPSPVLAARIANAFGDAYAKFRLDSARQSDLQAAELAQRQLLALSPADRRTEQGLELQARRRQLLIAAALRTGGVSLVRRASVPKHPSRPRPKLAAGLGVLLGLVLGGGLALGLALIDRRFKDERQAEELFDLPVLAAIPRPARRGNRGNDPIQDEAYGLLAANLRLANSVRESSVIMISSPGPREGKTSVTLGLARAYAQLGCSVIAIEADLRKPTFARNADVSLSSGLTGVLRGNPLPGELVWIDPFTMEPADPELGDGGTIGLLPAGELPAVPQRILSDPAVARVIDTCQSLAKIVLIDTAPIGAVNDATMLAGYVDGIALVARLNMTTKDAARRARRTLDRLDTEVLGLVITDAGNDARQAYYSAAPPGAPSAEWVRAGARGAAD
jgi:Mrp family chromosome partitioning ATPase/capsular polysaccharide biosynthesis protein